MRSAEDELTADQPRAMRVVPTNDGSAVILSFQTSDGREFHFALALPDAYRLGADLCEKSAAAKRPS